MALYLLKPSFTLSNDITWFEHTISISIGCLQDTQKQQKNELLFQKFGINYKTLPELFRQGSCLFKKKVIIYIFC